MNFLDHIWLIPLFPLCGAALMLLFGKMLDPQPPSEVAIAEGVEHTHDDHDHGHGHNHAPASRGFIKLISPGMVLLSFIFSVGAVVELSNLPERTHQVIQFTW